MLKEHSGNQMKFSWISSEAKVDLGDKTVCGGVNLQCIQDTSFRNYIQLAYW